MFFPWKHPGEEMCPVDIMPENEQILSIYALICNQVLVGGLGSVIGVNYDAFWTILDELGILDPFERQRLFAKLLIVERVAHIARNEEAEMKSAAQKAKDKAEADRRAYLGKG